MANEFHNPCQFKTIFHFLIVMSLQRATDGTLKCIAVIFKEVYMNGRLYHTPKRTAKSEYSYRIIKQKRALFIHTLLSLEYMFTHFA